MPERAVCAGHYLEPVIAGYLQEPALTEASGIVASPTQDDVLWLHNDSGDGPRIFAATTQGRALGELRLPVDAVVDVEDIAAGPCPDGSGPCLYVADTGDNDAARTALEIVVVPEPTVSLQAPLPDGAQAQHGWRLAIAPPDPVANLEALVVLKDASAMIFYEKVDAGEARIFRLDAPWSETTPNVLVEIDTFAAPGIDIDKGHMVTSASLHPSGTQLLVRTYTGVFEYLLDPSAQEGADHLDTLTPLTAFLGPLDEPQGEAVTYDAEGTGIWTVSERLADDDSLVPLHHAACGPAGSP